MLVRDIEPFLEIVEQQARLHGRAALTSLDDYQARLLGFKSPSGSWFIPISVLVAAVPSEGLLSQYYALGGRVPHEYWVMPIPSPVAVNFYQVLCGGAVACGEAQRVAPAHV